MAPAGPPRIVPTHLKDEALQKLLVDDGFNEFLTAKNKWVRIRWLMRAIATAETSVPRSVTLYIKNAYPQWVSKEAFADIQQDGVYHVQKQEVANDDFTEQVEAMDNPRTAGEEEEVISKTRAERRQAEADRKRIAAEKRAVGDDDDDDSLSVHSGDSGDRGGSRGGPSGADPGGSILGGFGGAFGNRDYDVTGGRGPSGSITVETEDMATNYSERRRKKPKFTIEDLYATGNVLAKLDKDNKSAKPDEWTTFMLTDTIAYDPKKELVLPSAVLTDELFEAVDIIMETNGQKCYDAEAMALGALKQTEYFLMPDSADPLECPARDVLRGRNVFKPDIVLMSQIFALAKNQATRMGIKDADAEKWALLRNQAFAAGWYCRQKYTKFMTPPKDSLKIYTAALKRNKALVSQAFRLAGFVPFFHETTFRAQCSTWTSARSAEFDGKAKKLATSCGYENELKYAESELIFGTAFRWIGVERIKEVLEADTKDGTIPNVFALRLESAPAGTAFICNCATIIRIVQANGWWDRIKEEGGYTDNNIVTLSRKIIMEPFKYHMMSGAYGAQALTPAEAEEMRVAKLEGEKIAPALHAYTNVFMAGKPLSQNKTMEKYAYNSGAMYDNFRRLFSSTRSKRITVLPDVFRKDVFGRQAGVNQPRNRRQAGGDAGGQEVNHEEEPDFDVVV